MSPLQTARSFLFAPGSEERKLGRALECGADAVIADLEDAVAPAEKDVARELATGVLGQVETSSLRLVRVNGVGTEWHAADLAAVAGAGVDGVVLPKATAAAVETVAEVIELPLVAIVETAAGLREAFAIASHARVQVLLLGAVDLGLALGLEQRDDGQELLFARSSVVVDSAAAGIRAPVDRVWVDVRDRGRAGAGLRLRPLARLPWEGPDPPRPGRRDARGLRAVGERARAGAGGRRRVRARRGRGAGRASRSTAR